MSRGGKDEIILSEETQTDLELYCLRRDLDTYKSFVNNLVKLLCSDGKDWLGSLKEQTDTNKQIGQLAYILGLLEKEK